VIETAAALDQVVFDKTGTLTLGRPLVTDVFGDDPDRLLQWAASLEQSSRHPLAYALLQEAQRRDLALIDVTRVSTVSGEGLWGELDGVAGQLRVGKPAWLQSFGVEFSAAATAWLAAAQGSVVAVSAGQGLVGLLHVEDQQRPDVAPSLERLRSSGLKLAILSGDREVAVRRLGEQLGFVEADLGWQMLPQQKLERLEQLRKEGRVAMVGDGINDAPALAAADLGIAIGTGTQIAQDTADMVLLGDRLDNLPEALSLARRTLNKVRQNLIWAFGYNLIALPVAAGVLLPSQGVLLSPPFAALLMALSSITVVVNALALRI
jgi:Cu2+-exporting ATPase